MTDINTAKSVREIIRTEQEQAYSRLFAFVYNDAVKNPEQVYKKTLRSFLKHRGITPQEDDLAFPSAAFMQRVQKRYAADKKELEEMFSAGECLTFNIFPSYMEVFGDAGYEASVFSRNFRLERENKTLVSTVGLLPLHREIQMALFTNGRFFVKKYTNPELIRRFTKLARERGYAVNEPEIVTMDKISQIHAYARQLYKDKLSEKSLPGKKAFIEDVYKNNAVCLTASGNAALNPPMRRCLALFSNGRFIISEKCSDKLLNDKVSDFIRKAGEEFVILRKETVPQSYIDAIYKKAEEFEWYQNEEIAEKQWLEAVRAAELKKPRMSEKEKDDMPRFIDELVKGGKCLTIIDWDANVRTDKSVFALFENGRFIVNRDQAYQAGPIEFEYIAQQKRPDMEIKKELVPAEYLPAIYQKILETQESCRDIYLSMLKKKAKRFGREENIAHHEALETIARLNGFQSWKEVCKITEEEAQNNITKETRKKEYLDMLLMQAKSLEKSQRLSAQEAKNAVAEKQGFQSWNRMENAALEKILQKH